MDVDDSLWRKSSCSGGTGGQCVELADLDAAIGIRDSKAPAAGHLTVSRHVLAGLIDRIKVGALDL